MRRINFTDVEDILFCQEDSYFIMKDKLNRKDILIHCGGYFISVRDSL